MTPAGTGSATGARRARWIAMLAIAPAVLVTFDHDKSGAEARRYWLKILREQARVWRPFWGDVTKMAQAGLDLRTWILSGLGIGSNESRLVQAALAMGARLAEEG